MEKVKDYEERIWYLNKTIENGWSRNVLLNQIDSNLYERQKLENKTTNFKNTLPNQ
jgi:predicted nuclease of restriction endonuclease-like (RecB) superfamily